jgi:hypothetical protein
VVFRRAVLPQLTPKNEAKQPPSVGRRIGGYAFVVIGGVITMLSVALYIAAAMDAKNPQLAWPVLIVLAFGGVAIVQGARWLTR